MATDYWFEINLSEYFIQNPRGHNHFGQYNNSTMVLDKEFSTITIPLGL